MVKRIISPVLIGLLAMLLISLPQRGNAQEEKNILKAQVGEMQFQYTPQNGLSLNIHGIPVIKGSSFWVFKPGWKGQYYGLENNKNLIQDAKVEDYRGGKRITLYHKLPAQTENPFEGKETIILLPNNTYKIIMDGKLVQNTPAAKEWKIGEVNPVIIIGKPYSVITKGNKIHKNLWTEPKGIDYDDGMVAKGFDSLEFQSKLGPIKISTQSKNNISFFDYRKNPWADASNPYFWMGRLDNEIQYGKPFHYEITFTFPKNVIPESTLLPLKALEADIHPTQEAQVPNQDPTFIVPTPKQLAFTNQLFPLNNQTRIYTGKNPGENIDKALDLFLSELKDSYGIAPQVIKDDFQAGEKKEKAIIIGKAGLPVELCKKAGIPVPDNPEGYSLLADNDKVAVAANTDQGLFYGLASLIQMVKITKEGFFLKGAAIQDYPALEFRGVHCLSGKNQGTEISRAVRTLLARNKLNSMVWECEYINWDSCPEIVSPLYGMTKKDAEKVKQAAQDNYVEIIPLVQSLGHSAWIFENGQHLDLAEDPADPYAYCVTNPDTYKFIYKVYQEALDFFHPRYFHIGHDEVNTGSARYPYRSKASGKSETELILGDILKHHEWFSQRNVKLMMWGDMFLNDNEAPDATFAKTMEEAKERRALLPKDITITDWHYVADTQSDYPSLKTFKDAGFDVIGAGWFRPENIRGHASACAKYGAKGYLQTTWAGFNFMIDNNPSSWHQYWAYINAAEYAWSGKNTPINDLPFQAQQVFFDTWFQKKPLAIEKSGFTVDLKKAYNRRLTDNADAEGWMGLGTTEDLSSFPTGTKVYGQTQFLVNPNSKGEAAIMLYGKFNPKGAYPQDMEISLADNSKASELHFLTNAGFNSKENTQIGDIKLIFTDGSSQSLELVYGKNIFAYDDIRLSKSSRIIWKGTTLNNKTVAVWDLIWTNPSPHKVIKKIVLHSNGTESCPIFFGITGVE